MNKVQVVSSDSHVLEPPDLWLERMDPKWGDRIPKVIAGEQSDNWYVDGLKLGIVGTFGASAGMRFENPGDIVRDGRMADVHPGGYDPVSRMKDLDMDGVDVDILYPSFAFEMYAVPSPDLVRDIFRTYNDWVTEFSSANPNRMKTIAMVLLDDDIEDGIKELHRAKGMGMVGAMISVVPREGEGYDEPVYEPFWTAAENLQMPLSFHVSTGRPRGSAGPAQLLLSGASGLANVDYWVRMCICQMVYSGVFERHPNLQIVSVEQDVAWAPYLIGRMDLIYTERTGQTPMRFKGSKLPSDFMRSNINYSFQEDILGIRDREIIGEDRLMWGSDYPHAESTFPKSQEILESILDGVPEHERAMIVGGNCSKLYGL